MNLCNRACSEVIPETKGKNLDDHLRKNENDGVMYNAIVFDVESKTLYAVKLQSHSHADCTEIQKGGLRMGPVKLTMPSPAMW